MGIGFVSSSTSMSKWFNMKLNQEGVSSEKTYATGKKGAV
jgi:hypothetical protein